MEVYNAEDMFLKRHKEKSKDLMLNIIGYLGQVGTAGDPKALQLLKEAVEHLKLQKKINNDKLEGEKAPNNLSEMLKAIQLSLAHIEYKKTTPPEPKNYAAATAAQTPAVKPKPNSLAKQCPKDKTPSPKEMRRAREITVHITNNANKEKIKALPTKDLVKALQTSTNGMKRVSRLVSGDIKIHIELLEAKKPCRKRQIGLVRWQSQPQCKYTHFLFEQMA